MSSQPSSLAPILVDVYLITCVVQRGRADPVVKAAIAVGAEGATIHYAHGTGARQRMGLLSMAINAEKEVITIAVSGEQRQTVFEAMSVAAELDTPGMGFMYMTRVDQAATFIPPDILAALAAEKSSASPVASGAVPPSAPPAPVSPDPKSTGAPGSPSTVSVSAPDPIPSSPATDADRGIAQGDEPGTEVPR